MRRLPLALAIVLTLASCDLNPLEENPSGRGRRGGGGGGGGGGGNGDGGCCAYPGPPIPPLVLVRITPSGLGSGRISFPKAPGFECTFAHEVVRLRTPSGNLPICIHSVSDSLILVAEPLWFASFGGWSAGCQPADQPTCRLSPAAIDWVENFGVITGEVHVRFDLTGTPPLTAVSGNDQHGVPGNALALPVVVQLRDSLDSPVANEVLEFETEEIDGSFIPATGTTDANGQFATTWILGSRFADQTGRVSATSESMWYATLELRATVVNRGTMTVSTQTVGVNPDSDGYQIVLDGGARRQSIGANGLRSFLNLPLGDHQLELLGLAANCLAHQNPRTVAIVLGVTLHTDFLVKCQ